jgi:hypothetical protein
MIVGCVFCEVSTGYSNTSLGFKGLGLIIVLSKTQVGKLKYKSVGPNIILLL